jgi:hypothetical protein
VPKRAGVLASVGLVAAAVLGGCTEVQSGQAVSTPTQGPPSQTAPSGSTQPSVAIPPRPKELNLTGLKACSLFTDAQLVQLKLDRKRDRTADDSQYKGMAECFLDANKPPFASYVATAVTNEGIGAWLTGKRNVEAHLSSVVGFAAATYWIRGANGNNTDGCTTSVDVAEGQQLMLYVSNDGGHSFTLEQLCQRAEQAAGMAVQTLQSLR